MLTIWKSRRAAAGLCGVAMGLVLLLAGCGGGTTGDVVAEPLTPTLPELSGTVTDGDVVPSDLSLQVTVKGNVGTARTAESRRDDVVGNYLASVDQLSGPYLIFASSSDFQTAGTMSLATAAGTANVTSLTTLVTAQVLAQDPYLYFDSLAGRGGFTAATDAGIAEATSRVRRTLQRDFGFTVSPGLGDFITTPFQPVAGDAMFDTLVALNATLAEAGTDYRSLTTTIAEEAARCRLESVVVSAGADSDPFCPFSKRNEVDPDNSSVNLVAFDNRRGDVLSLRTSDAVVLRAQFTSAEGVVAACEGAACSGIALSLPAADGTRTVVFSGARLAGAAGPLTLRGSLQTSVPGIALPGLPCSDNRFYLIHPDRSAQGWCALPDDFGLGAAGRSAPSGSTRLVYTFDGQDADESDGVAAPSVEVVTQGDTVLRVLVYSLNAETGQLTPLYQCRDGGCAGATLGAVTVDESLGIPIELRPVTLADVVLQAVLPDGSLSATDSVTLEASLTGLVVKDPFALPLLPAPCAAGSPVVSASLSDQAAPIQVCPPDDSQGFVLAGTYLDEAGNTVYFTQNLLTDGVGSFTPGNAVNVVIRGNTVVRVSFDAFGGPAYACEGSACTGVSVSAPNAAGERTVSLAGTLLQEVGTAGLPADRTATLSGSFVAPPP